MTKVFRNTNPKNSNDNFKENPDLLEKNDILIWLIVYSAAYFLASSRVRHNFGG